MPLRDMDCNITKNQMSVLSRTVPRKDRNFKQIFLVGDSWENATVKSGPLSPNDEVRVQVAYKIWATCPEFPPTQIYASLDNEHFEVCHVGDPHEHGYENFPDMYIVSLGAKIYFFLLLL
jgi:hypothetical protein